MRILIVSIGTYGDVLPFIGIGAELRRRGHEVVLASAKRFEGAARRAGVDFEPLISDEDYARVFEHPSFWRPFLGALRLFRSLPEFLRPTYDFVARRYRAGETLVVASHLALGARVAQEVLGAPVVSIHLTPIMLISRHSGPRTPILIVPQWLPAAVRWRLQTGLYSHFIGPILRPGLNAFRKQVGLKPVRKIRKWWHPRQRMICLFPDWFAPSQEDWPRQVRQLDFPRADMIGAESAKLDEKLSTFLNAGDPPVAITFGSARQKTDTLYRAAIEACARLGRRCLVLSQQKLTPPPGYEGQAFFSSYAPLSEVLPRCAALVHHGGIGTVALAFGAGIPQIVVPMAFDQFDHAARVRRLGCGVSINRFAFGPRRVARALRMLLGSPEVAEACAGIAARFGGEDAISRACDEVEAELPAARTLRRRPGAPPRIPSVEAHSAA